MLCSSQPHHNLCLVDLDKGKLYELTVYDPDPFHPGEISDVQNAGTFSFLSVGDSVGYRNTASYLVHAGIPAATGTLRPLTFCYNCRELLANDFSVGYMLADLSNPTLPAVYPLIDGAVYQIRCYETCIAFDGESNEWDITVFGKLNVE